MKISQKNVVLCFTTPVRAKLLFLVAGSGSSDSS